MAFLRRALMGIFLIGLTIALLAQAGRTVWLAVDARMTAAPPAMPQREQVLAVNVVEWVEGEASPELSVFGEVLAARALSLRAATGGRVVEVAEAFVDGGRVAAGDVLFRIDPAEAEAALARAMADLSVAEAELGDAEAALLLERDELAAAERQRGFREQALSRQRDLAAQGLGTTPDLEAAELAAGQAEQAVLSARASLAGAEARIASAEAGIARRQIDLAEAERTLADTVLRAAFDGALAGVSLAPGMRVSAGEAVGELIDPAALEVGFRLSTAQHADLLSGSGTLVGLPLRATLDVAGLSIEVAGTITREAARIEAGQTGRLVFAALEPDLSLRPGDFVTVTIEEPPLPGVARLPATALGGDGRVLVVGEEERLVAVPVELVRRQGNDVLLRGEGLDGALVVAARSPLLGAGIRVRPMQPGQEATAPEMVPLDPDHRARLVAMVEASTRLPAEAKTRIIGQLDAPAVPADLVTRIETGMGS
jgi:multidrug efflux pump subunit AcrA (membrane-fusion protein)